MRTISVPLILISLQDDGFHLLVEIVVFKKKMLAVVDTGASRSVFDKAFVKSHLSVEEGEETHATTLFTTTSTFQAVLPEIRMGSLRIMSYKTVALDLEAVNETYQGLGHAPIIGILGSDILLRYQSVINYKKLKLYFYTD